MLKSEKRRNVWLREAGTLGGRAMDWLGTADIVGERGDARRIDPAFCVLASLDPGQGRATRMARDVEALLASAQEQRRTRKRKTLTKALQISVSVSAAAAHPWMLRCW